MKYNERFENLFKIQTTKSAEYTIYLKISPTPVFLAYIRFGLSV